MAGVGEDRPSKRQRASAAAAASGCSKTAIAAILATLEDDALASGSHGRPGRSEVEAAVSEHARAVTPYGLVVKQLQFPGGLSLPYVCPFALLYYMCSLSDHFAALLRESLSGGPGRLIMYIDEFRPGNVLRPDKGRACQCVYWTLVDFPAWFRTRDAGWMTALCARTSVVTECPGQVSGLLRALLHQFYSQDGHNLARTGLLAPFGGETFLVRASFAGFLGDEKALKEVYNVKGASGSKPCLNCKNIFVQRAGAGVENDPYIRDLTTPRFRELDLHTDESIFEMVDMLRNGKERLTVAEFKTLQQALGLNFNADGLLFDPQIRGIVSPATGTFWDWMHVLLSNGVAGLEVHQLLCAVRLEGIGLEDVDALVSNFIVPKGRTGLTGNFFQSRMRDSADGSIRAFASEFFLILPLLRFFCEEVLVPARRLQQHIRCFMLLCQIVAMCKSGNAVLSRLEELQGMIEDHHSLFVALYPGSVRPKLHYLLHIPDVFRRLRANVSCFVTERKHRVAKGLAAHTFRHFERTMTIDILNHHVHEFLSGERLVDGRLENPKAFPEALNLFAGLVPGALEVHAATRASFATCGLACRGDIAQLAGAHGLEVGELQGFFQVVGQGETLFFMQVLRLQPVSSSIFTRENAQEVLYSASRLKATLIYCHAGSGTLRILEP